MKQLSAGMVEVQNEADKIMKENIDDFYSRKPSANGYQRTGALGRTPRTTMNRTGATTVSMRAWLNQSHIYSTGRDLRPMARMLPEAESGGYGIVGKPGFWARSENEIQTAAQMILLSYLR